MTIIRRPARLFCDTALLWLLAGWLLTVSEDFLIPLKNATHACAWVPLHVAETPDVKSTQVFPALRIGNLAAVPVVEFKTNLHQYAPLPPGNFVNVSLAETLEPKGYGEDIDFRRVCWDGLDSRIRRAFLGWLELGVGEFNPPRVADLPVAPQLHQYQFKNAPQIQRDSLSRIRYSVSTIPQLPFVRSFPRADLDEASLRLSSAYGRLCRGEGLSSELHASGSGASGLLGRSGLLLNLPVRLVHRFPLTFRNAGIVASGQERQNRRYHSASLYAYCETLAGALFSCLCWFIVYFRLNIERPLRFWMQIALCLVGLVLSLLLFAYGFDASTNSGNFREESLFRSDKLLTQVVHCDPLMKKYEYNQGEKASPKNTRIDR
jgi:hypothetical protein